MIYRLVFWMRRVRELLSRRHHSQGIYYIGTGEVLPAPLSRDREQMLLYALRDGDESARSELVEHNIRLVVYLARRFENTGICLEDLISIGTIGLMKAVNTFNVEKNIKLATYASRCIENEILMHLRKVGKERSEVSFDEPLNTDWDGNELLISDVLGTEEDIVERPLQEHTSRQLLFQAMDCLSERERRIISMRFGLGGLEECTQKEIADVMGISQSYISRLEKRIILRLRRELERIG
jgi:RNA polymerase sporulation-specific sigma factor